MSEQTERAVLWQPPDVPLPEGTTEVRWDVGIGSLVEAGETIGVVTLWAGLDVDIESACTGVVTYLATEPRAGEPLFRVVPLPADDPRVVNRTRVRGAIAEVSLLADDIRMRSPSHAGRERTLTSRLTLRPIIDRCAASADPVLAEALVIVRATVDAAAACEETIAGTVVFCDAGADATRWLEFRADDRGVSPVSAATRTRGSAQCVMLRVRAPGPERLWCKVDRALPLTIGADDGSAGALSYVRSAYADEIVARLSAG